MTVIQRFLNRLLDITLWRPWLTVAASLALSAASIIYTVERMKFETGQLDLISPKDRYMRLTRELKRFKRFGKAVVVIENRSKAESIAFLRRLVPLLEKEDRYFTRILYRIDPKRFRPWELLYLSEEKLLRLRDRLQDHLDFLEDLSRTPTLDNLFSLVNREMTREMVGEIFTGFLKDEEGEEASSPMDLTFLIRILQELKAELEGRAVELRPWEAFFGKDAWNEDDEGYFWTREDRFLLLFVNFRKTGEGFDRDRAALQRLRELISSAKGVFPGLRVGVTGRNILNTDEMTVSLRDMSIATVLSIACLIILLIVFWRGFRKPLLEIAELLFALSWTFGLTTLTIGHLNILSVVFAPLLLGLGIDYGIHWFSRYQEEHYKGRCKEEAVRETMRVLGPAIILAGITAACSFLPLVLTGFKGLRELGLITGMGMITTTVTTLCTLPALTVIFDRDLVKGSAGEAEPNHKELLPLSVKGSRGIIAAGVLVTALSILAGKGVSFDLNLLHLQAMGTESVAWERRLLEETDQSVLTGAMTASSIPELEAKIEALKALSTVSKVQSILSYLPSGQAGKISILSGIRGWLSQPRPFDFRDGTSLEALRDALARIRFKMNPSQEDSWGKNRPEAGQMRLVRQLTLEIDKRISPGAAPSVIESLQRAGRRVFDDLNDKIEVLWKNARSGRMRIADLPQELLERFVNENRYLIRVFPSENIWDTQNLGRFVRDIQSVDPDSAGEAVTLYIFTRAFRSACVEAAVYATIFIFVLLLLTFRDLKHTVLALVPLLAGTAWTLGLMRLLGVSFNLANSLFLPLIVGAGVEYGIVILHRWRQRTTAGDPLPASTGKGIILAALTTTVGFGSLTIADHRGIHSLGMLAAIGSLSVLAAAVFLLPALLRCLERAKNRQPLPPE